MAFKNSVNDRTTWTVWPSFDACAIIACCSFESLPFGILHSTNRVRPPSASMTKSGSPHVRCVRSDMVPCNGIQPSRRHSSKILECKARSDGLGSPGNIPKSFGISFESLRASNASTSVCVMRGIVKVSQRKVSRVWVLRVVVA